MKFEAVMLSAMQPGWLLLILFAAVVFLAGCAALTSRNSPPSPTYTPLPTLVAVPFAVPTDFHTPLPRDYRFTPQAYINLPPINPLEPPGTIPIEVESPTCYNSPAGQACLGRIWNQTQNEIINVTLSLSTSTDPEEQTTIAILQQLVVRGDFAPYHLFFAGNHPVDNFTAQITHSSSNDKTFTTLAIRHHSGQFNAAGRFAINATIQNNSDEIISHAQVVVTLLDEQNTIIGYRISQLEDILPPQAEQEIAVEIIPLIEVEAPSYVIHAEGTILRRGDTTAAE
ncbi:MAG: FxLYD domain-containing protein [Anaerolineae bacterium]|nr:FxLYD domain-containing protein [Anaerolineae bacterium]